MLLFWGNIFLSIIIVSKRTEAFFWVSDYGDIYDAVEFDPYLAKSNGEDVAFDNYDDYVNDYDPYQHHDVNALHSFWPDYTEVQYPDVPSKDPNFQEINNYDQLLSYLDDDLLQESIKEFLEENQEIQLFENDHRSKKADLDSLPILVRKKRARTKSSSSSRSKSSSSRWGSSKAKASQPESSSPSKPKATSEDNKKQKASSSESGQKAPSGGYPTGNYPPKPGYTSGSDGAAKPSYPTGYYPPKPGYPTGTNTAGAGYPTGTNPAGAGYPTNQGYPAGFVPPKPGYPSGTNPVGAGYPTGTNPAGAGYPTNQGYPAGFVPPKPGYPTGTVPGGTGYPTNQGYPSGQIPPKPGYPTGTYPVGNYPPQSGYPNVGQPGYPGGSYPSGVPKPGYPSAGYPGGSYPIGHKPVFPGSYPGSHSGSGYPGIPSAGHFPKPKQTKKEKAKQIVKQAVAAYATYKLTKKIGGKSKFLSPSHMPGMGFGGFGGSHHGGGGGMKLGKKVIGTAMKLIIARYAMKMGISAAKAYFEYKLGRDLEDAVIEKFISRYHRQRTRNLYRQNRRFKQTHQNEPIRNVTLGEDCSRECKAGDTKTCFFSFEVHLYQSLSRACYKCPETAADCERPECVVGSGRRKLIMVVNKQMVGPTIQVCEGDTVLLEVQNSLPSSGVTLHFRGQTYPGTPFMEGTPGVTQCPISSGSSFTYSFEAKEAGTHFWHAQTGFMRSDGVSGPFIVQELNSNVAYRDLYDVDLTKQTVMISEDFEKSGEDQYIDLYYRTGKFNIHSLLVNGKGRKLVSESSDLWKMPVMFSRILVETGKRHRLRLISSVSSNCPVTFNLLGQTISVISIDGSPVTPKAAKTVMLSPGERYDVVVESLSKGLYWAEFKGYQDCDDLLQYAIVESQDPASINETKYKRLLNFTDAPTKFELPLGNPKMVDPAKELSKEDIINCNNTIVQCSRNFTSIETLKGKVATPPNITLYFSLTNRRIHNEHFFSLLYYDIRSMPMEEQVLTPQFNNLTLKLPSTPLLVDEGPLKREFCSTIGVRRQQCVEDFCECIHLQELPLSFNVDIVLINEGKENRKEPQTIYFHGHRFWVLSQDNTLNLTIPEAQNDTSESNPSAEGNTTQAATTPSPATVNGSSEQYIDMTTVVLKDSEGLLQRNVVNPLRKDCVTIPSGGYAVIRLYTQNPGFWLLESSSIFKSAAGMGVIFRIGNTTDYRTTSKKLGKC